MKYFFGYLLIGMIYSGLTFKSLFRLILTGEKLNEIHSHEDHDKMPDDLKQHMIMSFLVSVGVSFVKIVAWPFTITMGGKRKKVKG